MHGIPKKLLPAEIEGLRQQRPLTRKDQIDLVPGRRISGYSNYRVFERQQQVRLSAIERGQICPPLGPIVGYIVKDELTPIGQEDRRIMANFPTRFINGGGGCGGSAFGGNAHNS